MVDVVHETNHRRIWYVLVTACPMRLSNFRYWLLIDIPCVAALCVNGGKVPTCQKSTTLILLAPGDSWPLLEAMRCRVLVAVLGSTSGSITQGAGYGPATALRSMI